MIIPPPTYYEPEYVIIPVSDVESRDDWVRWFMDCKPWMCACGLKNFGRNKACPKCKKPRPGSYVENTYEPK